MSTTLTERQRPTPSVGLWLNRPDGLTEHLRNLRRRMGLTGTQMSINLHWTQSKISKIENGRQMPTDNDVIAWAKVCDASPQETETLLNLLAEVNDLRTQWYQRTRWEQAAPHPDYGALIADARVIRNAEIVLIPALVQTAAYTRYRMGETLRSHSDNTLVDLATSERIRQQQILYDTNKVFKFVITEAVLHLLPCPAIVMLAQLDRLLALTGMPNIQFGIIPFGVYLPFLPPHGFTLCDDLVVIESLTGETICQDQETAGYSTVMDSLQAEAVTDESARQLIMRAIQTLDRSGL